MSAWSRWSFHLPALLSSTVNFSTTVYPVFNWDYRFFFFFSASASCHEVLLYFPSSCLVVCPHALLLLPLKKAQTNCAVVLVPEREAKKQVSTFILCFPSVLSPGCFFLFVHFSPAPFGILVFQTCLMTGMKNVFSEQGHSWNQLCRYSLNRRTSRSEAILPILLPLLLLAPCPLQGNLRGEEGGKVGRLMTHKD